MIQSCFYIRLIFQLISVFLYLEYLENIALFEVVETLNDYGILFIVDGIESNSDMCKALLCGANNVIVKDIKKSRETVDEWTLEMQNRYKESVDKSIKALSQKSKDR